jgi:hypothetical protein
MNRALHQRVFGEIPQRLAALTGIAEDEVRAEAGARLSAKAAEVADLKVSAGRYVFFVEYKGKANAADILAAIRTIREQAQTFGKKAIPLVAVPYMGDVGQRLCAEAGVNWLDLSGNAHLDAPGLRVRVEGKPNQFTRPGRPATVFAPKSARIARWLLIHPDQKFSQQELGEATGMDKGFTSRIVQRLKQDNLVAREEDGTIRVPDANALLEAWREAYDFSKHTIIRGHIAARSSDEIVRRLGKEFETAKLQHAVTGLAGAWLCTHFAGFRLVVCFVERSPSEDARKAIGFREEASGENVWLVVPNDVGVFHGASRREGIMCAHPVQVYMDLKNHPERSAEAAEQLRKELLVRKSNA